MGSILVDAASAPADLLLSLVSGVPLALWPVRALHRKVAMDGVGIMTSEASIAGLASRHGLFIQPPSPRTITAPGLIIDPLQPFILPATLERGLEEAARSSSAFRLASVQTSILERLRAEDDASLGLVRALALGLGPAHPAIEGIVRLRAPLVADIRLVVSDVDGTLTPGGITLGDSPHAQRTFHTHDGLGTHLLLNAGIKVAWLSATSSGHSIVRRAEMLRVSLVDAAEGPKGPRLIEICRRLDVSPSHTLYLGDDVNDLPAMRLCGLSACPSDARPEVRAEADLVLEAPGGHGAFREVADLLLAGPKAPSIA